MATERSERVKGKGKVKDTYDWHVTTYDKDGNVLNSWRVKDRTENQTLKDADATVKNLESWSVCIERPTYKRTSKRKSA